MNLGGHTVLITGGGSGIGRGLAEMFHAHGSHVIIAARDEGRLADVQRSHPGIDALALDLRDAESTRHFVSELLEHQPDLDIVVHNGGITHAETIGQGDAALAEEIIAVNLLGTIRLNSALVGHLRAQPEATIITLGSGLAFLPRFFQPTYCASKAAIHSYTQSLRYQLKDSSVRVLELIPPYVRTSFSGPHQAHDPHAMPLGDFITELTAILSSDPTPDEICVDGVRFERDAQASGNYDALFTEMNDAMAEMFRAQATAGPGAMTDRAEARHAR
jgi:uncharacterized oxidoreductase